MDASNQVATRSVEPVVDIQSVPSRRDTSRTLTVTAVFHLSEEGRKASLLDGGNGRAVQQVTVAVPTTRFHLVSVDAEGTARLKLQPRYFMDTDQNVLRSDGPPTYDSPPSTDDLLRDAARNHQLERAYYVEQAEKKSKRRDEQFEIYQKLAEDLLADPNMRALEHPKPTPRQCYLQRGRRRLLFDAKVGHGLVRQVPPEAYRLPSRVDAFATGGCERLADSRPLLRHVVQRNLRLVHRVSALGESRAVRNRTVLQPTVQVDPRYPRNAAGEVDWDGFGVTSVPGSSPDNPDADRIVIIR